jgi:heme exporter protein D
MQTPVDPLAELRDIHLPPEVSWWPLAYGWWLVAISLLVLLAFVVRGIRRRRRSVKRFALEELKQLEEGFRVHQNSVELAVGLSELLRRMALARFARADVASLFGKRWVHFLTEHADGKHQEVFTLLESSPYAPAQYVQEKLNAQQAIAATKDWIRRNAA